MSDVSVQEDKVEADLSVFEEVVDVLESEDGAVSSLTEPVERNVDTTLHHRPDRRAYHPPLPPADELPKSVEDSDDAPVVVPELT